ncbi:nucleoid occlusion factor SlmA [Beggiatoa alba]|nr:nucleoid occlusion factor SlmA [Beggiatoa alba]
MANSEKPSRRQQILESLARKLEESPGERITTAGLARAVGVSEAALYRHFPSKAKMFEGLIEFIEDSIFGLTNRILNEEKSSLVRCEQIIKLLLTFAERNAGMTRLLTGEALTGETERLRSRIGKFFERFETQLKQVLREGEMNAEFRLQISVQALANLMLSLAEGHLNQYVRSGFKVSPLEHWQDHWQVVKGEFEIINQ